MTGLYIYIYILYIYFPYFIDNFCYDYDDIVTYSYFKDTGILNNYFKNNNCTVNKLFINVTLNRNYPNRHKF